MLRRLLLILGLLLGLVWIAAATGDTDPRTAPPPGRAVPPPPELDNGDTVTAAGPVPRGAAEAAAGNEAAVADPAPAAPRLRFAETHRFGLPGLAQSATALEAAASTQALPVLDADAAETGRPRFGRGRHAVDETQWRRYGTQPAPLLGPQALPSAPTLDFAASSRLPQLAPPAGALLEVGGSFMLDRGTLVASASPGAAFIGEAPRRGAPLELVLPQPPPRMPLPSPRSGLTELSRGNAKQKRVALTFDDGPHPEFTSQLLAILDHYHARATFFIVGVQAQKYPQWVKMIHQAGHEVANHTYDHFRLPALPAEEQAYQIDECTRLLEQLTGTTPRFLRPPGGRYTPEVGKLLRQRGMVLALWDVGLNDTAEDREAADLLSTASTQIRPGSVVLGHDGIQATVDMLPHLIETLQKQGYELVTMSELAAGS